jgi:hypothetical protein
LNLIVWAKTNAGMGSLYRSQHELLPLLKKGTAPHVNNVELGKRGRWRSNVWTYPDASSLGSDARRGLKDHPSVKPTVMLEDALLDLSNRSDIVVDPFLGSGSTLIAAEKTGRVCPARGVGAALVLPYADADMMQLHLDEISRNVAEGAHAVLLLDRAGWHTTGKLDVPDNITPIFLPSRAPELNPVENVWQYLRQNWLSNTVFENYDAIVDAACAAWRKLIDQPETITSIGMRDWAHVGQPL